MRKERAKWWRHRWSNVLWPSLLALFLYLIFLLLTATVVSQEVLPTVANFSKERPNTTIRTTNEPTPKTFIYLTQTEQCLPPNLVTSSEIGDPKTCHCDVIVLSFQTECQGQHSSHITYLFDPETGWGTGRNVLYFAAINRKQDYHYYIFLDEDAVVSYNEFTPPEMKTLHPFRAVENWLLDYEPVVGVLDYGVHHGARWTFDRRQQMPAYRKVNGVTYRMVWWCLQCSPS